MMTDGPVYPQSGEPRTPLFAEMVAQVQAYLSGTQNFDVLSIWVARRIQVIADSRDPRAIQLDALIWRLAVEWGREHRTDDSIRAELRDALALE